MATASITLDEGVTLLGETGLQDDLALTFAASLLAEITHLPTGAGGGLSELVNLPPGGEADGEGMTPQTTLVRILSGQVRLAWGQQLQHSTTANPGDSVLLPAGVAFRARNESTDGEASFILVRGG